jgi:hypothetical protein
MRRRGVEGEDWGIPLSKAAGFPGIGPRREAWKQRGRVRVRGNLRDESHGDAGR